MKYAVTLALALLAAALVSCCPGTLMNGGPAQLDTHPHAISAQPADADGDGVPDNLDRCPDTPRGEHVDADGCSASQRAAHNAAPTPPPAPAPAPPPAPEAAPAPAPAPSHVEQELTEHGTIRLDNVYFVSGSATLTPESSATLDEAAAALAKYPNLEVEVGGHTDARGNAAKNLKLSQTRAEVVRQYLIDHGHLEPGQVKAKGYGSRKPISKGKTAADLKLNRRVELKVLNPGALPKNVDVKK